MVVVVFSIIRFNVRSSRSIGSARVNVASLIAQWDTCHRCESPASIAESLVTVLDSLCQPEVILVLADVEVAVQERRPPWSMEVRPL